MGSPRATLTWGKSPVVSCSFILQGGPLVEYLRSDFFLWSLSLPETSLSCYIIVPQPFPRPPVWGFPTCLSGLVSYPSLHRGKPGPLLFLELAVPVSVLGPLDRKSVV